MDATQKQIEETSKLLEESWLDMRPLTVQDMDALGLRRTEQPCVGKFYKGKLIMVDYKSTTQQHRRNEFKK